MTTKMKLMRLFVPLERVEGEDRIVQGPCWANAECGDGFKLPRETLIRMTPDYLKWANVREMHGKNAVGTSDVQWPEEGPAIMRAEIIDDAAWKKCQAGVYKGFSVGIKPTKVRRVAGVTEVVDGIWYETSLVDRPADPDCVLTLGRADGTDAPQPEPEFDVEVIEDDPKYFTRGLFNDMINEPYKLMRAALSTLEECVWNIRYDDKCTDKASAIAEVSREFASFIAPHVSRCEDKDGETLTRFMQSTGDAVTRLEGELSTKDTEIQRLEGEVSTHGETITRLEAELKTVKESKPDPTQAIPIKISAAGMVERFQQTAERDETQIEAYREELKTLELLRFDDVNSKEATDAFIRITELKRLLA